MGGGAISLKSVILQTMASLSYGPLGQFTMTNGHPELSLNASFPPYCYPLAWTLIGLTFRHLKSPALKILESNCYRQVCRA